jgi:dihydroorotate dehydrogenase electron transfer subunit
MKLEIAKVTANSQPMTGAHRLWLEAPKIAAQAKPGQFVMVRCGEDEERQLRRPLSVHQRVGDQIALLFNIVGGGTQWLSQRASGDKLDLLGPLGNGFSLNAGTRRLLLAAGGIGVAPMHFIAEEAVKKGLSVTLLYGAPTATYLYPHLPDGIDVIYTTEDGSAGKKGMVTDIIPDFIDEADQIFACGPLPMYKTMARMPELKNKSTQVSLEVRMGCGVGVCYGCTVKTTQGLKQVCKDGPVFELNDILWDKLEV